MASGSASSPVLLSNGPLSGGCRLIDLAVRGDERGSLVPMKGEGSVPGLRTDATVESAVDGAAAEHPVRGQSFLAAAPKRV